MTNTKRIKILAALITLMILTIDTLVFTGGIMVIAWPGDEPMIETPAQTEAVQVEETDPISSPGIVEGQTGDGAEFYESALPEEVISRMMDKSYPRDADIDLSDLRYVRVLYIGFDGKSYQGELVVHRLVAEEALEIFRLLYDEKYPIGKMVLIDDYNGDDNASMADNNTSAFCWRQIPGGGSLSSHAAGLAIDINPLLNPYIREEADGTMSVLPEGGEAYLERHDSIPGLIVKGDVCYNAFISRGWLWGGDWTTMKDYQHFYKPL